MFLRLVRVCFALIILMACIGPWLSPYGYSDIDLIHKNLPPGKLYWFGSDELGRDLFCRVWWGARISLSIGCFAALIDTIVGVLWGVAAAYAGGWVEEAMMRFCDLLHAIPTLLMAILLALFMGPGFGTVLAALAVMGWTNMARISRAQALQLKQSGYVLAAKALGASGWRIIFRHILPNSLGPIAAAAALTIPSAMFTEAFLSFLGLGVQAPHASWGVMIQEGIGAMQYYPWRLFIPAGAITLAMLCLNILGNAAQLMKHPSSSNSGSRESGGAFGACRQAPSS